MRWPNADGSRRIANLNSEKSGQSLTGNFEFDALTLHHRRHPRLVFKLARRFGRSPK